jgi:hypothetical protein
MNKFTAVMNNKCDTRTLTAAVNTRKSWKEISIKRMEIELKENSS